MSKFKDTKQKLPKLWEEVTDTNSIAKTRLHKITISVTPSAFTKTLNKISIVANETLFDSNEEGGIGG